MIISTFTTWKQREKTRRFLIMINSKYTMTFLYSIKIRYVIYLTVWSISILYKKIILPEIRYGYTRKYWPLNLIFTITTSLYGHDIVVIDVGHWWIILTFLKWRVWYINIFMIHLWLFWNGIRHFAYSWKYIKIPICSCKHQKDRISWFCISQFRNAIWMCTTYFTIYSWNDYKLVSLAFTWKVLLKYIYSISREENTYLCKII